jgi:hypothetical protein
MPTPSKIRINRRHPLWTARARRAGYASKMGQTKAESLYDVTVRVEARILGSPTSLASSDMQKAKA